MQSASRDHMNATTAQPPTTDHREGESAGTADGRLLRACRREPVDATPVWFMRQAGRHLPAYRALREKHAFLEMATTPEIACQITLMPLEVYDVDAAIVFSDILLPLPGMGMELTFTDGKGPELGNMIRDAEQIERLRVPPPEEVITPTLQAIRLARAELEPRGIPVIGFAGAPFTLAAYAVEGGASRTYEHVKGLMMREPAAWAQLMGKLADLVGQCLVAQVAAGAAVVQMFDSWAGALSPADYEAHVLPYSRRAIERASAAGAPVIHFATGNGGMLELFREAGGHVIGVDWRVDLGSAWARLGPDCAGPGKRHPVGLPGVGPAIYPRARQVLEGAADRPGHIFNVGHGILPTTAPANVSRLVDFVHDNTTRPS